MRPRKTPLRMTIVRVSTSLVKDALDARGGEAGVGRLDGSRQPDGAGEVFDDEGLEAEAGGGEGAEADAEVVGEAGEEEPREAALAQVAGEAGGRDRRRFR
jgi:hypothetical protein